MFYNRRIKIPAAEDFLLKTAFLSIGLSIALVLLSLAPDRTEIVRADGAPLAIPTFNFLGLYGLPPGGAAEKEVLVRYWRQGELTFSGRKRGDR